MVRFVEDDGGEEPLAPVIPLFGTPAAPPPGVRGARTVAIARSGADRTATVESAPDRTATVESAPDRTATVESAERLLLKRLRLRSLSIREARALLAEQGLEPAAVDELIGRFCDHGYLDDVRLAEQLVHIGLDRKRQGRQVIAQTLAKRGVMREIADEALASLPDDDAERALEYARTKARSLSSLDHDTALRRLVGQLGRRGFPGSVAMRAATQALADARAGSAGHGVRFR